MPVSAAMKRSPRCSRRPLRAQGNDDDITDVSLFARGLDRRERQHLGAVHDLDECLAHRQLTPHPLACYARPIRLSHPAGNGLPMTYIACTKPRYPVSAGMHERVQAMPHIRFRPIAAGHNCILSAPDLVANELLEIPTS